MENGTTEPAVFAEKTYQIPHMDLLIASSGFTAFAMEWRWTVTFKCKKTDIEELNEVAPELMRQTWERSKLKHNHPVGQTPAAEGAMLYHFGFAPSKGRYTGYRYYSEDGFEPKEMPKEYVQPINDEVREVVETKEPLGTRMVNFFKRAKTLDDQKPPAQRIGVGGEVWLRTLSGKGFSAERLHVFDDYDETLEQVREAGSPVGR
jgi:hypothetical protein